MTRRWLGSADVEVNEATGAILVQGDASTTTAPPSSMVGGTKTVALASTPQALVATPTPCRCVWIGPLCNADGVGTNTKPVFLGDSTNQNMPLLPKLGFGCGAFDRRCQQGVREGGCQRRGSRVSRLCIAREFDDGCQQRRRVPEPDPCPCPIGRGESGGQPRRQGGQGRPAESAAVQVTGILSPDATGSYNQNGTYNGSPAFERVGGGWWLRYDYGVAGTYYWRICQGTSAMTATARWSGPLSTTYPGVVPDQGSYTPMSGATGTATVTVGQSADDYLASYDANGNLVLAVQKSDVVMKTDGVFTLAGEVQEGTGTVATGDNSHAEGLNSKCGYAADTCTISGTTVTISGNATTRVQLQRQRPLHEPQRCSRVNGPATADHHVVADVS